MLFTCSSHLEEGIRPGEDIGLDKVIEEGILERLGEGRNLDIEVLLQGDSLERLRIHLEVAEEDIPEEGTEGMVEEDILKEGTEGGIPEVEPEDMPVEEGINWDMQEVPFLGMVELDKPEELDTPASLAEPLLAPP